MDVMLRILMGYPERELAGMYWRLIHWVLAIFCVILLSPGNICIFVKNV
jgi:hypothetical protein